MVAYPEIGAAWGEKRKESNEFFGLVRLLILILLDFTLLPLAYSLLEMGPDLWTLIAAANSRVNSGSAGEGETNWLSMAKIWGFEASAMHAADQEVNKFFILDVRY